MSLLRGIARTAVISGTATAVSGRVQRRQAARFAEQDAQTAAMRHQAYSEHVTATGEQEGSAGSDTADMLEQLRMLGDLRAQGVLTDEEFEAQKRRILAQ